MARLDRQSTVVRCDWCHRTLLLGERISAFREGNELRSVCQLCEPDVLARGWRRDGSPAPPPAPRPRRRPLIQRIFGREPARTVRDAPERAAAPSAVSSVVRLTPEPEEVAAERTRARDAERAEAALHAIVAGVELFNASAYRRTVHGIAKSLGAPRVSIVALPGTRPDVVITIAWELSWYRYRVDPGAAPAVRLEGRGDDLSELDRKWRIWNGVLTRDGMLQVSDQAGTPTAQA
jgi:hypothetical protein